MTKPQHTKLIAAPHYSTEVEQVPELNTAQCIASFTVSTPAIDNDGDILVPEGSLPHLERYRANPVVLWCHDKEIPPLAMAIDPISKMLSWNVTEHGVKSSAYFHCKSQESTQIWAMIEAGFIRGASVGYEKVEGQYERLPHRRNGRNGIRFLQWEPLEWSVCPIPVNPETLLDAIHRPWDGKALSAPLMKSFKSRLPDGPKTFRRGWVATRAWKRNAKVLLGDAQGKGMAEDSSTVATETETTLPPGAQALQGFASELESVLSSLNDSLPQVENPEVLALCEEVGGAIGEQVAKLGDGMKRIYPEIAGAEMANTPEAEKPEKKAKAIVKAEEEETPDEAPEEEVKAEEEAAPAEEEGEHTPHMNALGDGHHILNEMASSPHVPKSYRMACEAAAMKMKGACDYFGAKFKKAEGEEPPADEEEKSAEEEPDPKAEADDELSDEDKKAIMGLAAEVKTLRGDLYRVTGKRVA